MPVDEDFVEFKPRDVQHECGARSARCDRRGERLMLPGSDAGDGGDATEHRRVPAHRHRPHTASDVHDIGGEFATPWPGRPRRRKGQALKVSRPVASVEGDQSGDRRRGGAAGAALDDGPTGSFGTLGGRRCRLSSVNA
jgi:hypothetical protein